MPAAEKARYASTDVGGIEWLQIWEYRRAEECGRAHHCTRKL